MARVISVDDLFKSFKLEDLLWTLNEKVKGKTINVVQKNYFCVAYFENFRKLYHLIT